MRRVAFPASFTTPAFPVSAFDADMFDFLPHEDRRGAPVFDAPEAAPGEIDFDISSAYAKGGSKGAPVDDGTAPEDPVVTDPAPEETASKPSKGGGKGGGKPAPADPDPTDPDPTDPGTTDPDTGLLVGYTSGIGGMGVVSDYNVDLAFDGLGWTEALQADLTLAAEYLSTLILGDVPDVSGIDDIEITVRLLDIDGVGGILGAAAPGGIRAGSLLPSTGLVQIDLADAQSYHESGLLDDIMVHEMLHTLGFGGLWEAMGLTAGSVATDDMVFTGGAAALAWAAMGGTGAPAIETDGGSGTAGVHWDEAAFGSELMTGWLNGGAEVSALTAAALEDMGYDTVFDPADPAAAIPQIDDLLFA